MILEIKILHINYRTFCNYLAKSRYIIKLAVTIAVYRYRGDWGNYDEVIRKNYYISDSKTLTLNVTVLQLMYLFVDA